MATAKDYNILEIISEMEIDFVDRIRRHERKYIELGYEDWKRMQLREMKRFREEVREMCEEYSKAFKAGTEYDLRAEYMKYKISEASKILKAWPAAKAKLTREWAHSINDKRMIAMINAIHRDYDNAIFSLYRQSDDIYRGLIYKSSAMVNSGSYDLVTAIDTANRGAFSQGVRSVPYYSHKTGDVLFYMPVRSYLEMATRTNSQRAAAEGRAMVRDQIGVYTVRVSYHNGCCPKCAPHQGQIYFDDVYCASAVRNKDNEQYPALSEAIDEGLLHPNCRHSLATYDPAFSLVDDNEVKEYTEEDEKRYKAEQEQRAIEREIRKAKREAVGTIGGNKKVQDLQAKLREHLDENPKLARKYWRERD